VLFADALMNLTPWALWDLMTGEPADGAATVEAKAVLERALARDGGRAHPGILHIWRPVRPARWVRTRRR
jgi:hypothetical protein